MNRILNKLLGCGALLLVSGAPAFATPVEYELFGGFWYALSDGSEAHFTIDQGSTLTTDSSKQTVTIDGSATLGSQKGPTLHSANIELDLTYIGAAFLSEGLVVGREGLTIGSGSLLVDNTPAGRADDLYALTPKFLDPNVAGAPYTNYGQTPYAFVLDTTGESPLGFKAWIMGNRISDSLGLQIVGGDFHAGVRPSEVPEPTSALLLGIAGAGGLWRRRRAAV